MFIEGIFSNLNIEGRVQILPKKPTESEHLSTFKWLFTNLPPSKQDLLISSPLDMFCFSDVFKKALKDSVSFDTSMWPKYEIISSTALDEEGKPYIIKLSFKDTPRLTTSWF